MPGLVWCPLDWSRIHGVYWTILVDSIQLHSSPGRKQVVWSSLLQLREKMSWFDVCVLVCLLIRWTGSSIWSIELLTEVVGVRVGGGAPYLLCGFRTAYWVSDKKWTSVYWLGSCMNTTYCYTKYGHPSKPPL